MISCTKGEEGASTKNIFNVEGGGEVRQKVISHDKMRGGARNNIIACFNEAFLAYQWVEMVSIWLECQGPFEPIRKRSNIWISTLLLLRL